MTETEEIKLKKKFKRTHGFTGLGKNILVFKEDITDKLTLKIHYYETVNEWNFFISGVNCMAALKFAYNGVQTLCS